MKTSIIIPTFHRPKELTDCLTSILKQTVLPTEVIIIDDGELDAPPLAQELSEQGIALSMHRKKTPGLTESRNLGAQLATGDIVFYLDDDTVLFPDYVGEILKVYKEHPHIGGVGGIIANPKPMRLPHHLRYLFDILFLNRGLREGKVLPSGFCTDYGTTWFPVQHTRAADFLDGGVSSFKRSILQKQNFTERYREFGLGEDKDYTIRVARAEGILICPHARLYHYESPKMRPNKRLWGKKFVLGRYLFYRDHVQCCWWHPVCFAWAVTGYSIARGIIAILSRKKDERERMVGIFEAVRDIILDRIDLPTRRPKGDVR